MFKFKTEPYAHQLTALEKSYDKKDYGYFMEMGCGKSKVLLDNIAYLASQGEIDTAVIVAPKGVYRNWETSEIPTHLLDEIQAEVYVWNPSANKAQAKELGEGAKKRGVFRILLANVEGFASSKLPKYVEIFTKGTDFLLAVDESTTIKNPKAKRTKTLVALGGKAKYKRILTGSPVTKSPLDLYSQCGFMNKKLLGMDSYWSFQGRYAITKTQRMGSHSFQKIVGYRNLEELSDKLTTFSYRVTKEEALDLPAKIYTTRYVGLSREQIQHYASLKSSAIAILDSGELISASAAMTQLLRLQQLLCGHLKTDEGDLVEIPSKRLAALMECVEEMDGKIIIWSRFRYDIVKIKEALAKEYGHDSVVSYYGDTTDEQRQNAIASFQHGDARFFIGNPQTAGYGLTLTAATNVVYYANDFNLETRVQSEDRCHRIGQKHSVTYVDLVTLGTVDEHIVKVLQQKINLSAQALGEEVRKWLNISPQKSE